MEIHLCSEETGWSPEMEAKYVRFFVSILTISQGM
jgi:hypothetical protein